MIWACFIATGPGHLVTESAMNSSVYQSILELMAICLTATGWKKLG